jgi:hypothetical protein
LSIGYTTGPRPFKEMQMLRTILIGFVVLVIGAVVGARVYLETFTKPRFEAVLSAALGTEVSIDRMSLGLLTGDASFHGVAVRNPEGYDAEYLLRVDHIGLGVDLASLLEPEVVLKQIVFDDVRFVIENAGGRTNYEEIIDGLGSGEDAAGTKDASEKDGRSVVVTELRLNEVRAMVHVLPDLGVLGGDDSKDAGALELEIPEIRLSNLGAEGTEDEMTTKVSHEVLSALLRAIADETGDLPGNLSRNLLRASQSAGSAGFEILGDVSRSGGEALGHLPGLKKVGKSLGEGLDGAFDAMGRLVGSDEEKKPNP